jgi:hypothetical protein
VASPEKSYDSLGWAQIGLGGGDSSYFHLLPHAPAFSSPYTVDAWTVLLRQKIWQGTLTLGQREDMSRGALNGVLAHPKLPNLSLTPP